MAVVGGDKVVDDVNRDALVGYAHHHTRFGHDTEACVANLEEYGGVDNNRRSEIEVGDFTVVAVDAPAASAGVTVVEYLFPRTNGATGTDIFAEHIMV